MTSFSSSSSSPRKILISTQKQNVRIQTVFRLLLTFTTGVGTYIVVLDKLLLLGYHVLQVNYSACLQLQVQEQLHILTLKEVVLHHELQEVFVVLEFDPVCADGVSDVLDLLVVFIQVLFHALSLLHVGLG